MTPPGESSEAGWLSGHIGRLAGIVLGALAVGFLAFLAALGFAPALGLLVIFLTGVVLIVLGGKIHGR